MIDQTIGALGSGGLIGFTLGLIGGGGSILATPLLLYVVGVSQPHIAIGTGALAVSANAYANLISHAKKGNVWWRCAAVFALIGIIGAFAGSSLGKAMNGQLLMFLFGFIMVLVGALMLRPRKDFGGEACGIDAKMCIKTAVVALAAGFASGFFGIGGGFLIVPALIFATRMPTINAVGTSLLAVGTFGLATAINYALDGMVDWKIAAEMIAGGIVGGFLGMKLSTKLGKQKDTLNRIFAILIFFVAIYVIYKSGNSLFAQK
jgi:uncharacterized membrane protein YfcA